MPDTMMLYAPSCSGTIAGAGRMMSASLASADVESALMAQNVELPAGRLESEDQNLTLRVDRPFTTEAQFARLVVGRGSDGYLVRLGDVARVEQGPEDPYQSFRTNGQNSIGLGIVRQSGANTLEVADRAKALAEEMSPTLPAEIGRASCREQGCQ